MADTAKTPTDLRLEYALLERALHASQSGIVITDAKLRDNPIIWCSPGFVRMTGYSLNEIVGKNCRFLQGPDTDPNAVQQIREAIAGCVTVQIELFNYRRDKTTFWNDLNISPVHDATGQVTHFIGIQNEVTERKARNVEEIARIRQYAQLIVDTIHEPLLILDNDLCVVTANIAFYDMFRVEASETENIAVYELGNGQWDIPDLRRLLEEVLPQQKNVANFEVTHNFPRIGQRTMLLNARAIDPDDTFPGRILLAVEDVTHRRETLEASVSFARGIIDALAANIAILDESGQIVAVNAAWDAFAQQSGGAKNSTDSGIGQPYFTACEIAPADEGGENKMAEGIRTVMAGEVPLFEYEYPCHTPDEHRWFLARVTRMEYGGRAYAIVAHENITLRRASEEARQESEDKYRLLTEGLPQFVWLAEPAGGAEYVNGYFYQFTGLTPANYDRDWASVIHPDDLPNIIARFEQAIEEGEAYQFEYRVRHAADAKYYWFLAHVSPLRNRDGAISRWVGAALNVDAQKRNEAERNVHLTEIEALNVRLRRSVQETHHRVKNNLQVINALLEMNLIEAENEVVPAEELQRVTRHIGALAAIHDLLTLQTKSRDNVSEISARAVLTRLLELLAPTIEGRKVVSRFEDIALPVQKATSMALLVNELVSNAYKHSAGVIEMDLVTEGGMARLAVCDDGAGFPPNFDPKTAANTGLELIESAARWDLRGTVVFDNHPGGGGRVTVIFPLD